MLGLLYPIQEPHVATEHLNTAMWFKDWIFYFILININLNFKTLPNVIMFETTGICESTFSVVNYIEI